MGIIELMQGALDKTNDPDAIFALDKGIIEVERLREALHRIAKSQPSDCEQAFNFKMIARAALAEKPR